VQRATRTASGPVDSSGWPTDQAVTLILTQDATGGHTVNGVTVDPAPGSVTVTAWVWTGSAWRGFSDYGTVEPGPVVDTTPPTAGTLTVAVDATTASMTVQGALDDVALHAQPFRFAYAPAADAASWTTAQWGTSATWTDWQTSGTYTGVAGLTASTTYAFRHETRDAAGNARMGGVVEQTTLALAEWTTLSAHDFATTPDGTVVATGFVPETGPALNVSVADGAATTASVQGGILAAPPPGGQIWSSHVEITPQNTPLNHRLRYHLAWSLGNTGDSYVAARLGWITARVMGNGTVSIYGQGTVVTTVEPDAPAVPLAGEGMIEIITDDGNGSGDLEIRNATVRVYTGEQLHTTATITGYNRGGSPRVVTRSSPSDGEPKPHDGLRSYRIEASA
jgi:hypothetical protein